MKERLILSEPSIVVFANELGDIVLKEVSPGTVHQVTVWMRRIAAEFEGLRIPEGP